jgi:hypothetical protein
MVINLLKTMNIKEASTKRGIIWVITGSLGALGWWLGKDITPIMLLGATIAGGLGVSLNDKD